MKLRILPVLAAAILLVHASAWADPNTPGGGGGAGGGGGGAVTCGGNPCSTAALQSNVQSAPGTPQTVAITIQGNAAGVPLPVAGTFSGTVSGFAPASVGTPIAVTTGGVTGTLPAGTTVVAFNVGTTNTAYCALGGSSTTSWVPITPNGGWFPFVVGVATQLTCVTSTSTTTVNMVGGAGLPTGTGGGSAGGGSGGNVTIVSPLGTNAIAASVAVTPATSSVWPASQSGTWTVQPGNTANTTAWLVTGAGGTFPITASALPLPAGAALASHQTDATQKTQIVDGSGNVIASTSNNLDVQCANCSGSGVSTADKATFTSGSSLFAGAGGFFQTTATANPLTNGQQGVFQTTAQRALFTNMRNSSGSEIGISGTPLFVGTNADAAVFSLGTSAIATVGGLYQTSITTLASGETGAMALTTDRNVFVNLAKLNGVALGSPSAYGTSPGAVSAQPVNAFITNTPAVTCATCATAANQTNGSQKGQIVDGSGNVIGSTSNALNVSASSVVAAIVAASAPIPLPVSGNTITWTQTKVTLTAATSATLLPANAARRALRWMNTGANPVTIAPGAVTVTVGDGMNYNAGAGAGQQGGADSFGINEVSTDAFSAISTLGTTVIVWEGQ